MAASGASASTMNQACAALRFFFHVTLGRPGFWRSDGADLDARNAYPSY